MPRQLTPRRSARTAERASAYAKQSAENGRSAIVTSAQAVRDFKAAGRGRAPHAVGAVNANG